MEIGLYSWRGKGFYSHHREWETESNGVTDMEVQELQNRVPNRNFHCLSLISREEWSNIIIYVASWSLEDKTAPLPRNPVHSPDPQQSSLWFYIPSRKWQTSAGLADANMQFVTLNAELYVYCSVEVSTKHNSVSNYTSIIPCDLMSCQSNILNSSLNYWLKLSGSC